MEYPSKKNISDMNQMNDTIFIFCDCKVIVVPGQNVKKWS